MHAIIWIVLGLVALIAGAELIVRGGTRVAARLRIPPIIIGLTIVSVGTSVPELAVGIEAANRGNGSLAVGNIAGTNVVNLLLILGTSALLRPLALTMQTLRIDLPVMGVVAIGFLAMCWNGQLSRLEGGVMVAAGIVYTLLIIYLARRESSDAKEEFAAEFGAKPSVHPAAMLMLSVAMLGVGIAIVVVGSDWLVDGAATLARGWGVSEALIGLTIVAIGTSSPELATTIIGTLRNDRDVAVGNLLGSSIYNILAIMGITCLVPATGVAIERDLVHIDIPFMVGATLACIPVFLSGRRVTRIEGGVFVAAYVAYLVYLVTVRT
jgi:cation:H+ antiporter